ncbi:MAG: class I SAM-dependent methyltransferase [Acidimicrobiales bacterium]
MPSGDAPADTDLDRLRHLAYADPAKLEDRRAIYAHQDPRPDFYGWILDQVDWPDEGRVLDLGCGPGTHLALLAARRPRLTMVGGDVSTGMLAAAREALASCAPVALDAGALPFADDSFDAVMANHMLYHVADLDRAAAELRRVIVSGGRLLAVTNSLDHFAEFDDLMARAAGLDAWWRPSHRFNLEHSGDDLSRHFDHVDLRHCHGELAVPDVGPMVAFARSMRDLSAHAFTDDEWAEVLLDFERLATAAIAERGPFRIRTHTGAFVCS